MNDTEIIEIAQRALFIAIQLGAPILLVGLFVGVTIALFQALTQIQEMTLVFVPKILAIFVTFAFFLPSMMKTLIQFMEELADKMVGLN